MTKQSEKTLERINEFFYKEFEKLPDEKFPEYGTQREELKRILFEKLNKKMPKALENLYQDLGVNTLEYIGYQLDEAGRDFGIYY
ncbi:hypothetical protein [Persephonella sp.]